MIKQSDIGHLMFNTYHLFSMHVNRRKKKKKKYFYIDSTLFQISILLGDLAHYPGTIILHSSVSDFLSVFFTVCLSEICWF